MSRLRVINVWQIAGWNRNVGDWVLNYNLHRLLNKQAKKFGLFFKFYPLDGQRTFFHRGLVDQMNEEADLVMVGGGGLIFHRPADQSVSGWAFNISIPDLKRIKKPIVVYSLGNNKFAYGINKFPPITSKHLKELQKKSVFFSVRANGVKNDLIKDFGLNPKKIEVIPDPGMFLHDRPITLPIKRSRGPLIAVNLAGDRPRFRYPQPAEKNEKYFRQVLKSALLRCVKELNAQILFLPHLTDVDLDAYADFKKVFPKGNIFNSYEELPFLYTPAGELLTPHVPFFTNIYRQIDLMLGMRLHSCIFAYGASKKFMPLGGQDKLRHFVEDIGVPDYTIELTERKVDTADSVFKKIASCLNDSRYKKMLPVSLSEQLSILHAFNQKIISLF